jgi:hypothetical protein
MARCDARGDEVREERHMGASRSTAHPPSDWFEVGVQVEANEIGDIIKHRARLVARATSSSQGSTTTKLSPLLRG